jgi:hypothetical protein
MSRSIDSIINEILNKNAHLISDMGVLSQVPSGSIQRQGFAKYSRFFCDSIIFWGIHNYDDRRGQGGAIGKYVGAIRETFKKTSLEVDSSPKCVGSGLIHSNTEYFGSALLKANREKYADEIYRAGYIAVKVSLKDPRAKDVIPILDSMLPILKKHGVILHDIDLTKDCRYITTRSRIKNYLEKKGITTVKNDRDRTKVGDHCISWMGHTKNTKNIRYKVYNKFVQMMESAEVRKPLGSRMEDFVVGDGSFSKRLIKHKDHGFSRLELTFYGPKLLTYEEYHNRIVETMELLEECPTFECSFENQWRQRADRIKSMIAIYLPEKEKGVFAYCHWRNSVTSKKYGYVWKNVLPNVVSKLLANYSFNDRPIYYFEAKVDEDEVSITKEVVYSRQPGCTAITLVPGGSKGMFPSRDSFPDLARKFSKMGFVEVDNISIGWPKKRFNKNSAPLAEIVEGWNENKDEGYTRRLKEVNSSVYRSSFTLDPGTEYTIVAAGLQNYRKSLRWHFITQCGKHVRAGKSLHKLWDDWRYNFEVKGRTDVEKTKWMTFLAVKTISSRGIDDMKCKLA